MSAPEFCVAAAPCLSCGEALGGRYGPDDVCWGCWSVRHGGDGSIPEPAEDLASESGSDRHLRALEGDAPGSESLPGITVAGVEEFASVEESGAEAIVGDEGEVLVPRGGDVMIYGAGGAGKTTLAQDFGFHVTGPTDWLGYRVPCAVRVLVIENEGPRPLMRRKLARKLGAWAGPPPQGRLMVFESPWAQFTFATAEWRKSLAVMIEAREIDVLIAGPLTRVGMSAAGTLQEVNEFMGFVQDIRVQLARPLTVVLIHHENKGGTVSGAWEGSGDLLLHVQARGHGSTAVHVEKARWSSAAHNTTLDLAWTDGEGFKVKDERDLFTEIKQLLMDDEPRTLDEIRKAVGAGKESVRLVLDKDSADSFTSVTGEDARALGRHQNAKLYRLALCLD